MIMKEEAERIVKKHAVLSMTAGFIPIPIFDIVTVTAMQVDMLQQLAILYEVDFSNESGKTFVSALTGGAIAKIGSSLVKSIPGVGAVVGGLSMAAISGASTYAVGEIACIYFEKKENLADIKLDKVKGLYNDAIKRGKEYISGFAGGDVDVDDNELSVHSKLQQLKQALEDGLINEDEYKSYKKKLLDRL